MVLAWQRKVPTTAAELSLYQRFTLVAPCHAAMTSCRLCHVAGMPAEVFRRIELVLWDTDHSPLRVNLEAQVLYYRTKTKFVKAQGSPEDAEHSHYKACAQASALLRHQEE